MVIDRFRCNSSLDLEGGFIAHQGQASPLSLESSDYDRLWSTKYLHTRTWFSELGGFFETRGSHWFVDRRGAGVNVGLRVASHELFGIRDH